MAYLKSINLFYKTRQAPLICLLFAAFPNPRSFAFDINEVQKLWALPMPMVGKDKAGLDLIKVMVYPHKHKTPDKKNAEPLDQVSLVGVCQLGYGHPELAAPHGKTISNFKAGAKVTLKLDLKRLKKPLWLECQGPTTVNRNFPLVSHSYESNFYIHKTKIKEFGDQEVIQVVAVMPIETYLRGVLPSEIIPSWPEAALRAQAIVARSFAYFNVSHNQIFPKQKKYDVDDTNRFQAFSGLTSIHPRTDAAVSATKGQIITYKNLTIPAFFDTDAGGQTESAKEVFKFEAPYCAAKTEPPEVLASTKSWRIETKLRDLGEALGAKIPPGQKIIAVETAATDVTGGQRVRQLTFTLENSTKIGISIEALRKIIPGLKSSMIKASLNNNNLVIEGKGAGHGVGLSQMGMKSLATSGWSHEKILGFYFDGIKICSTLASPQGMEICPKPQNTNAH